MDRLFLLCLILFTGPAFAQVACGTNANGGVWNGTSCVLALPGALPSGTTATTQSALDNSTKLANTTYVDSAVAAAVCL